jgi:hypothetical protein
MPAKAEPLDEFYVKVLRADRGSGELEIELATQPKKTKVLFTGDIGQVFDGEYIKMQVGKDWKLGGKLMKVVSITWVF